MCGGYTGYMLPLAIEFAEGTFWGVPGLGFGFRLDVILIVAEAELPVDGGTTILTQLKEKWRRAENAEAARLLHAYVEAGV